MDACCDAFHEHTYMSNNWRQPLDALLTIHEHFVDNKWVILDIENCLNPDEADYFCDTLMKHAMKARVNPDKILFTAIRNNYLRGFEGAKHNDMKRIAATLSFNDVTENNSIFNEKEQLQFADIIENVITLLKTQSIVPHDVFPTASGGVSKTMHFLIAEPKCKAQHFHYDYDQHTFEVSRKDQSFKGSSMFINFCAESYTVDVGRKECNYKERKVLVIPPRSVFVFRGDFKHAGSTNKSETDEIWKYFLYLDPEHPDGFRSKNIDSLYYDDDDDVTYIMTHEEQTELNQ